MWPISFGKRKSKAIKCYLTLLLWIIAFSSCLYWLLTRKIISDEDGEEKELLLENKHYDFIVKENIKGGAGLAGGDENERDDTDTDTLKNANEIIKGKGSSSLKDKDSSRKANHNSNSSKRKIFHSSVDRLCNKIESIQGKDEYLADSEYELDALLILFRHGKRGPLSHIGNRNISHINCRSDDGELKKLIRFSMESMGKIPGFSQFIGPFHSFSRVPISTQCQLGQLTQSGASQLIKLGQVIRSIYESSHIFNSSETNYKTKIIAYSSRYRRTFQSLISFLWGLSLSSPRNFIPNVSIRESQSINFCFNDCSCRGTDLRKAVDGKAFKLDKKLRELMMNLIDQINLIIGNPLEKSKKTGNSLLDLLLVYPCHDKPLPCRDTSNSKQQQQPQPFQYSQSASNRLVDCVALEDLSTLISLIQRENYSGKRAPTSRQQDLITSYGLLKEIVNLALQMTSNDGGGVKVSLFSGHDITIQNLLGGLGVYKGHPDIYLIPFASRLIIEFYRKKTEPNNSVRKHYIRFIFNGISVTHLVRFCPYTKTPNIPQEKFLCPLENFVRFIHDHYFETFGNSTNFRDACKKLSSQSQSQSQSNGKSNKKKKKK